MKKNNRWIFWVILGVLIIFAFGKTGFLGSLLTICENNEPDNLSGFPNATSMPSTTFMIENGTMTVLTYSQNELGIMILGTERTCKSLWDAMNGTTGTYLNHPYKINNGQIYWCNKANNIMLFASNPERLAKYYSDFEICRTQEYTGTAYEADPDICKEHLGNWTIDKCICPDGSRLKINDVCKPLETGYKEEIPPPSVITEKKPDRTVAYVMIGVIVIAIGYLVYTMFFTKKKERR